VKLLEAEPVVAPEVAPEAPRETPPEQAPAPPEAGRACKACGAPMEPDQDWCLACGTAAAGSLGERPGWRAATTITALALVLVLGAVGAGYAALKTDNSAKTASTPTQPAAQPPAQAQVAPPTTTTPETTQSTPTQQQTTTAPKSSTLPKVHSSNPGTTQGAPVTPVRPTPTTSTPSTPTTSTPTTSTPTTSTPTTSTPTTTTPAGPQPIELKSDAGSAYDPYSRAKASGQTARALDGDASTSWYVDPTNPQSIGVGYAVDLGKLQGIREIQLQTTTPGFKVEIYATDEPKLPPDILDTRWSHITNVSNVGAKDDGKQKIVLGAGTTKYRNLLLWFTNPPTDGPRLRLVELKLLG
jgi:hypothetical protein